MIGLAGHVLNAIVDVVSDTAVMRMIEDNQPGQEDRVLQPMHRERHEVVALALVVQGQGQEGHDEHKNGRAANDGIGDAGVVEQLGLCGHIVLVAASFCKTPERKEMRLVLAEERLLFLTHILS